MIELPFIDCQNLIFSPQLAENRMSQAQQFLGSGMVQRLMCYALYLLGANRSAIGQALNLPTETTKSIIKAINKNGPIALEDRRRRFSTFLPKAPTEINITLRSEERNIVVDFGIGVSQLKLSQEDPLQLKIVLLSMLNSGLLTKRQVAEAINLTESHTAVLARRLQDYGASSLADQRQGQKQDYRVTSTVKAELIQQFSVDVITSGQTSGSKISAELKDRCNISVPARTVRHHMARMGLGKIKKSLPELISEEKKISKSYSSK